MREKVKDFKRIVLQLCAMSSEQGNILLANRQGSYP